MTRRAAAATRPVAASKQALGVPRSAARAESASVGTPHPAEALYAAMSEAQFQRSVRAELSRRGYIVWVFPIMKRTMAGVPDLTFFHVDRPGLLWCWELKRERRYVVSPAQAVAIAHLATVPGVDARIVRPSQWPALRDAL